MLNIFKQHHTPAEPAVSINDLIHDGKDYFSDELIILDEPLAGNLFCAEKVVIKAQGVLDGNITSKNCMVTGVVNGNITSLDLLDIRASAVVRGNIQSATIHIEPGAIVNGYIIVGEEIEALTTQWNKTKFSSTDDYLTASLKRDLAEVNKLNTSTNIVVQQKIDHRLSAATKPTEPLRAAEPPTRQQPTETGPTANTVKPPLAAAAPPPPVQPKQADQKIERWW